MSVLGSRSREGQKIRQHLLRRNEASGHYEVRSSSPAWALLGLRGAIGLHSDAENDALRRHASGRHSAVEIGVAEGASARTLCDSLAPGGALTLIDPYPPGRVFGINLRRLVAKRQLARRSGVSVRWVRDFSFNVARRWTEEIDLLFIDGDHAYEACERDFEDWSPFVAPDGVIAFHDARVFPGGWTTEETGSVRFVREAFSSAPVAKWHIVDEVDSLVVVRRLHPGNPATGR